MFEALFAFLVTGLGCVLVFWAVLHADNGRFPLRRAFVSASLTVGLAIFLITEGLSAIRALNEPGMLLAWLLVDGLLLVLNLRLGWREPIKHLRLAGPSRLEGGIIAGCLLVAAMTGLVALIAAPNNWDAMTYHMARVGFWVQSWSVDYHAAFNLNRDYQAPLASYAMLDLFLLGHGDQLANLVDWASFIGSIVVASLVAAQMGASRIGQGIAGLVVATLPMAILQATSSQNHITVAFWLLCLAAIVPELTDTAGWRGWVEAGLCLGLAILTKGSAYAFAAPFVVWAGLTALRKFGLGSVSRVGLMGLLALALNLPTFVRNFSVFGSPLGPSAEIQSMFVPSAVTPGTLVERALQEASLQLGTPSSRVDQVIGHAFTWIATSLGLDLTDPRVVQPTVPWGPTHMSLVEDNAGNLLAFALILAVAVVITARYRGTPLVYLIAVAGSCLLYFALLRFTVWNSRWSLALFVIAAPLVGVAVRSLRSSVVALLGVVLLVGSGPWLLRSYDRPLVGTGSVLATDRTTQYFAMRPELQAPYTQVATAIDRSGCHDVGYALRGDEAWEYPLWRMLNPTGHEVSIRDVLVTNVTAKLQREGPPCMIVFFEGQFEQPRVFDGATYQLVTSASPMYLYERSTAARGHEKVPTGGQQEVPAPRLT